MMSVYFSSLSIILLSVFRWELSWLVSVLMILIYMLILKEGIFVWGFNFYGGDMILDGVSFSLVGLSVLICLFMILSSSQINNSFSGGYYFLLVLSLMVILLLTFSVSSIMYFYFFFEASLIPTFLIIMGWGYQPERLQASIYFLFYTLAGSLPLLLVLYYFLVGEGSLFVGELSQIFYSSETSFFMFIFCFSAFLIKLPMFFVHLWLPKAHVEAPVAGSMILAGVLLKLGGYGLYKMSLHVKGSVFNFGGYFFGLSLLGMVYVGLMCCRLSDLKALVAYSSVAHMAMVIGGFMSMGLWGINGALMMMLAHGVSSSGLFCAVNLFYERSGSRGFMMNRGMITFMSGFTMLFFMLCISNMAAPPTINLLSEIFLMGSMLKYSSFMMIVFPLGSYLGALFTLYFFSYSQHGKQYEATTGVVNLTFRESHILIMHLMLVNIIILVPEYFMLI